MSSPFKYAFCSHTQSHLWLWVNPSSWTVPSLVGQYVHDRLFFNNWSARSRHQKDIVDPFYADHIFYTDPVIVACLVSAIQNISYHCKCIWNEMIILLTVRKTLEECQSSVVKGEDILGYVRHWSEKYVSSCYIQFTQIDAMSLHFEQVISSTMNETKFQKIKKCYSSRFLHFVLCTPNHSLHFVTGGLLTTSHMRYKICLVVGISDN